MDVRPCAKRTAVGWRGAAGPRSCSHGHDRHRQPRHDRRRAPGLRPDAGADGGARPADARRGAGRVAVDGPPGRHAAPRPHLVLVGRRGARRVLEAGRRQGAQPAREPAADGRGRRPRGRLLGRADRGRGDVPRRARPSSRTRSSRSTRRELGPGRLDAETFRATYTQAIRILPTRYLQWHGRGEAHDPMPVASPPTPAAPRLSVGARLGAVVARLPRARRRGRPRTSPAVRLARLTPAPGRRRLQARRDPFEAAGRRR